MPDDPAAAIWRLIRLGKELGYVTYDEAKAIPRAQESPEMAEDLMATLNDCGIHVVAAAPDGDGAAPSAGR